MNAEKILGGEPLESWKVVIPCDWDVMPMKIFDHSAVYLGLLIVIVVGVSGVVFQRRVVN